MPGPCRAIVLSLSTLFAIGCGDAFAATAVGKRPLQLKLSSAPAAASMRAPVRAQVAGNGTRAPRFRVADRSLGERALQSLMDDADEQAAMAASSDGASFRFKRRSNAGRDLAQGYNNLCENVSRKVWDDPNGKRVKFDVAGKPGVGIEIPLR